MLTIRNDGQKWWIDDPDDPEPIGPYTTKSEAESDRRGIERFLKHGEKPGYVTSEKPRLRSKDAHRYLCPS